VNDRIVFTAKGGTRFCVNLDEPDPCLEITLVGQYAAESVIANPRPDLATLTVRCPIPDMQEFLDYLQRETTLAVAGAIGRFLSKVVS